MLQEHCENLSSATSDSNLLIACHQQALRGEKSVTAKNEHFLGCHLIISIDLSLLANIS
jgi:hypothetical protein